MSDIPKLITKLETLLQAVELARGTASELHKLEPLEVHLYNMATQMKANLEGYRAMLKDASK